MTEWRDVIGNDRIRVRFGRAFEGVRTHFWIEAIELFDGADWRLHMSGARGQTFWTSMGSCDADEISFSSSSVFDFEVTLYGTADLFRASVTLAVEPCGHFVELRHRYRFLKSAEVAVHPGLRLHNSADIRYTFPLRVHEGVLSSVGATRSDIEWALPFPFHVWHDGRVVGLYGVDRSRSVGTLDFLPVQGGAAILRTYWPDVAVQPERADMPAFGVPQLPQKARVEVGTEIEIVELVGGKPLSPDDVPLLEAARMAASRLLRPTPPTADHAAAARRIVDFFRNCELWESDALGESRGWFRSMWTFIEDGEPRKDWPHSTFDLGWGEGIAVETWVGVLRNAHRTGDRGLLPRVEEMSRSIERFKRSAGDAQPYFDRYDRDLDRFGDFMTSHGFTEGPSRIWIHSLAHTGNQLLACYESAGDLVSLDTKRNWRNAFISISAYLARIQRSNGDLPDVVGDDDLELNKKPHRIAARLAACGLWSGVSRIDGDLALLERAVSLARAVGPEVDRFEYYNQMLDGICSAATEFVDGEAAYYAMEGLVPLFEQTADPYVLSLCRKAAAFGIAWTYFFDLRHGPSGRARGGQCCRMPDFPLLYPIGPAKGIEPLLRLSKATGDRFLAEMAGEMAAFIAGCLRDCPGRPWHGAVHHAIHQPTGRGWGPDLKGQADTGMSSGNALAALEYWLANHRHP